MLCLTRKSGEWVYLDYGTVRIKVRVELRRHDGAVKLYFDAPKSVAIVRAELLPGGEGPPAPPAAPAE